MRATVRALAGALSAAVSAGLDESLTTLESTAWPEVVTTWSGLTPTGFPVELTVGPSDSDVRWTAEVAGPEVAEVDRLRLAADRIAEAGCGVDPELVAALTRLQEGRALRFGAWVGGRPRSDGSETLKMYAEVPDRCDLAVLGFGREIRSTVGALPAYSKTRMLGIDPSNQRAELYLRPSACDPDDLGGFFYGAGVPEAFAIVDQCLPGGRSRLRGCRLGVSITQRQGVTAEVALFVSARTLFPCEPERTAELVPILGRLDGRSRIGPVTLGFRPGLGLMATAIGVCPERVRSSGGAAEHSKIRAVSAI